MIISERINGGNYFHRYIIAVFDILSILFLEAFTLREARMSQLIIIGSWILFCFFITFNYFGEMTSTATVEKPVTGYINSWKDMEDRNISWILPPDYILDLFLEEKLPLQAKYKLIMSFEKGLDFILQNPTKYVYLSPSEGVDPIIRLKFWDGRSRNPFHFSPPLEGDVPLRLTVMVRKDSPFTEAISKKILQIDASGVFKHKFIPDTTDILVRIFQTKNVYQKKEESKQETEKVTLGTLSAYLYLFVFILIAATIVFIVEIILLPVTRFIIRLKNKHRRVSSAQEDIGNQRESGASNHYKIEERLQGIASDQEEIPNRNGEFASVEKKKEHRRRKAAPVWEEMKLPQYMD